MKKLFALILILSLVLSSLTGCFLFKKDDAAVDGDKKDPIVADGSDNKGDEDPADDEAENPADEDGSTDGTGGTNGTGTNTGTNGGTNNGSTGGTDSGTAASGDWEDEDSTPTTPTKPTTPTTPKPPTPPTTPPVTNPDVVTTASLVNTSAAFEAGISSTGKWIVSVLTDIFFDKNISADGEFVKTDTTTVTRKIALYEQNDSRVVTAQYSLVAPSLTVNSPNLSLTNGALFGDLIAKGVNTTIVGTKVTGNVYVYSTGFLMKNGGKDTFGVPVAPEINGKLIFMNRDAYRSVAANLTQPAYKVNGTVAVLDTESGTGASLTADPVVFANSLKADGEWIICGTADVTSTENLVLDGAMIKTGTLKFGATDPVPYNTNITIQRKIAMYEQAKYAFTGLTSTINVPTKVFTLKAPSLTIKSPFARIQNSRFEGNLYIEATDFLFIDSNVIGNTYFASQAAYDGVKIDPVTRGKLLAPGNKVFVHNGTEYVEIPAAEFKAANTTDPQYLTLAPVDPATTVIINNNRP